MARAQSQERNAYPLGAEVVGGIDDRPQPNDVLVYNARRGIYMAHLPQVVEEHSSERQQRIQVRTMTCFPGLTFVRRSMWEQLYVTPRVAQRIADGELMEVVDFSAVPGIRASAMVRESADVATLRRLLEGERRDDVERALRKHIDEVTRAEPQRPSQGAVITA